VWQDLVKHFLLTSTYNYSGGPSAHIERSGESEDALPGGKGILSGREVSSRSGRERAFPDTCSPDRVPLVLSGFHL